MGVNERPKRANAGNKMNDVITEEKKNEDGSDEEDESVDDICEDDIQRNSFLKAELFDSFYEEYLEFKHYIQDKVTSLENPKENIDIEKIQMKNEICRLQNEIKSLKDQNTGLKEDIKSNVKIIECLSDGKFVDAPWNATYSKKNKNINRNEQHKINDVFSPNPYDVLYMENNVEITENHKEDLIEKHFNDNSIKFKQSSNKSRYPTIVPGNRSYASTTKYGKKVVIIGDSHISRINKKLFNDSLLNCESKVKNFGGATIEELESFIKPYVSPKNLPDGVLIHVGSNDINFKNIEDKKSLTIAEEILKIGVECREKGVQDVVISSILPKNNIKLSKEIRQVNDHLEELCKDNGVHFLSNDNISRNFICGDGVHLEKKGTHVLAGNFVNFFNTIYS